ncbi:hypothetical protein [Alloactinosynnema sp. L-07]|uniref:hypothetical protein n=1 Tax=Alloactinosynnema sp. L-07 TaxID=1653480 RepID=UPI0006B57D01|nr:hypothetical protein [Alloactinosynnema sp. L-07]
MSESRIHTVTIELREVNAKRLRKSLSAHLRERGMSAAEVAAMGPGDLVGEVVHDLTSHLAEIVGDAAELTVTMRER